MDLLQIKDGEIVDARANVVRLRGCCVGGWMNMENFIDGYPGSEHGLRAAMAEELGPARAEFFFDRLLDHFFADEDVAFIRDCGATVVRLPLNYRHFERDAQPFAFLEAGFRRLDRALDACERHGVYAILDLHAVQGWQNPDWHSDNGNRCACFWEQPHFQERFYALWRELARRYRDRAVVAGYNVMNEPVTNAPHGRMGNMRYRPDWENLNRVYRRVVEEIRSVDPKHIVFLEGDFYSTLFEGLEPPFDGNLAYSGHAYNMAGFGPGRYPGTIRGERWDRDRQQEVFDTHQGVQYCRRHNVPYWVGEFGAVYNGPAEEKADRLRAMDDQLAVYDAAGVHWTTWTYKDVGVMGWVELDPESPYMERIAPILQAKRALRTDLWMGWLPQTRAGELVRELAALAAETIGDPDIETEANVRALGQAALDNYLGALMQRSYARLFKGLGESEIDRLLASFAFKQCKPNEGLVALLRKHLSG